MGIFDKMLGIKEPAPAASTAKPSKKILIVEDDKTMGDSLETIIKQAGYATFRAENGKVGLEVAASVHPDLIILDLIMPEMDGKAMLNKLRQIPEFASLPVIVLTNDGTVDNVRETKFYNNAIEFLIKSNVSLQEIVALIRQQVPA